ncbi:DUF4062 domain-containing protein [Chryseobacterium zhengzhouense]|uniref:DUF4062 domain-containing protein n=1 Tax=Chryseobacterium zhengzhouense TaxID=1636086 RepID=A0ABW2LTS1_9FLAO
MAKPRVFISSTFYDLRHIRTDVEHFVIEMGYEPIRNENGDIPYGASQHLEEYCYNEVVEVDILVGIIGGRYGSQSKDQQYSITQTEIKTAFAEGKQVYIFIEKNVLSEYYTYSLNKGENIKFAHADNVKVYEFIEEIYSVPGGIIIAPFENVLDITRYLKSQWAGLFRDMLRSRSEEKKLSDLSSQIEDLKIISESLKNYLEISLPKVLDDKSDADEIIKNENGKIIDKRIDNILRSNHFFRNLLKYQKISLEKIKDDLINSPTMLDFKDKIMQEAKYSETLEYVFEHALHHINEARLALDLDLYEFNEDFSPRFKFHHDGTISQL